MEIIHKELTDKIIGCFFKVYNTLGYGFLEKVYENSMMIELANSSLNADSQVEIKTYYEKQIVGIYYADIIVEEKVILELKAHKSLREEDYAQLLHYLKASDIKLGLLMNFGRKPEFKRIVF
jgi:GxxExxY protein